MKSSKVGLRKEKMDFSDLLKREYALFEDLIVQKEVDWLLIQKSDRDRIQTCNRLIRRQLLYSVELRDRYFVLTGAKIRTFPELASFSPTFFVENYSMNR